LVGRCTIVREISSKKFKLNGVIFCEKMTSIMFSHFAFS